MAAHSMNKFGKKRARKTVKEMFHKWCGVLDHEFDIHYRVRSHIG